MCFSPTASFTAAAGLTTAGILTLSKTRTKKEVLFAMIPLLFGIQQAAEGFVWISIANNNSLMNIIASHIFVFFAYILWPVYIPLAVLFLEKKVWRKKMLYILEGAGIALGAYFIYFMTQFQIAGHVMNRCIVYSTPNHDVIPIIIAYVATTCISLLISSNKTITLFGLATSVFLLVAYGFYNFAFVSVWCFFAAALSAIVYLYFSGLRQNEL